MTPEFWKSRWAAGQIGFHQPNAHPGLVANATTFPGNPSARVLVPLCGKTQDLAWLVEQGHDVVGVEVVQTAVEQLFEEAGLTPTWDDLPGEGRRATSGRLTVLLADYFAPALETLGTFDAIWDRAALVALSPDTREAYAARHRDLLRPGGRLLIDVLQYDPARMDGPPWSVSDDALAELFPGITLVSRTDALDARWRGRGHTWLRSSVFEWVAPAS